MIQIFSHDIDTWMKQALFVFLLDFSIKLHQMDHGKCIHLSFLAVSWEKWCFRFRHEFTGQYTFNWSYNYSLSNL